MIAAAELPSAVARYTLRLPAKATDGPVQDRSMRAGMEEGASVASETPGHAHE